MTPTWRNEEELESEEDDSSSEEESSDDDTYESDGNNKTEDEDLLSSGYFTEGQQSHDEDEGSGQEGEDHDDEESSEKDEGEDEDDDDDDEPSEESEDQSDGSEEDEDDEDESETSREEKDEPVHILGEDHEEQSVEEGEDEGEEEDEGDEGEEQEKGEREDEDDDESEGEKEDEGQVERDSENEVQSENEDESEDDSRYNFDDDHAAAATDEDDDKPSIMNFPFHKDEVAIDDDHGSVRDPSDSASIYFVKESTPQSPLKKSFRAPDDGILLPPPPECSIGSLSNREGWIDSPTKPSSEKGQEEHQVSFSSTVKTLESPRHGIDQAPSQRRVQIVTEDENATSDPFNRPIVIATRTGEQYSVSTMGRTNAEQESWCFSWIPDSWVQFTTYVLWLKLADEEYPPNRRLPA